jgi:hypothetical protein
MSRKVKVVNINQAPAAKPLGVNPMDPWQAKSGIAEASEEELLHRFLNSRGINPKFVSTETKIAHSKSGEFLKWRRDHEFTEELTKENHIAIAMGNMLDDEGSMVLSQLEQLERAVVMIRSHIGKDYEKQLPAWVQAKVTLATDYIDTVGNYITSKNEKVNESVKKPKPSALDRFRKASAEREKKHDDLAKNSGGMTSAIDRLQKHLNKEETINEVSDSEVQHHFDNWTNSEHAPYNSDAGDDNKVHQSALRYLRNTNVPKEKHEKLAMHIAHKFHGSGIDEASGISKAKETSFHKNLDTLVHKTFGKRKDELKMKEEVEMDEAYGPTQLDHDTVKKHLKNIMAIDSDEPTATSAAHAAIKKVSTIGKTSTKSTTRQMLGALIRKHKIPIDQHHRALLNKEGVELDEEELDQMINEVLGKDASAGDWIHDFIHSDNPKFAGKSKKERQKMALGAYYGKQNEEFEQLDELKKSTVFSWLKQQPVVPEKKPGMSKKDHNKRIKTRSKSWNRALDRLSGYKPTSENTLDSLAATQAPCDGANGGETTSIKSQRSKSARMIKALYKRKGMVKEDTYDHEKEDKSVQTYGKKPKFNQTDKKDSFGEKKPEALAVMTGGTTLTGEKRDEVEIDPMMKNRPGQNQFNKEFGKKGN